MYKSRSRMFWNSKNGWIFASFWSLKNFNLSLPDEKILQCTDVHSQCIYMRCWQNSISEIWNINFAFGFPFPFGFPIFASLMKSDNMPWTILRHCNGPLFLWFWLEFPLMCSVFHLLPSVSQGLFLVPFANLCVRMVSASGFSSIF